MTSVVSAVTSAASAASTVATVTALFGGGLDGGRHDGRRDRGGDGARSTRGGGVDDAKLHAAVLRAAVFAVVRSDGAGLTEAV